MPKRKPGKPTLSAAEVDRVLTVLKQALKDPPHNGNQSSLARALHVEPSAINQLLSDKNKPSYETAKALGAHLGQDFKKWLDPSAGGGVVERETPPAAPHMDMRPFYVREHWVHLYDPALETLIREGYSAAESRAALDGVVAVNTSTGAKPTLEDVLRLARTIIKDQTRASGKIRKNKHT